MRAILVTTVMGLAGAAGLAMAQDNAATQVDPRELAAIIAAHPSWQPWLSDPALAKLTLAGPKMPNSNWNVDDIRRPQPRHVETGTACSAAPPGDAEVLFDGRNLDKWTGDHAGEWTLKDGENFVRGQYSRGHTLRFDGGAEVAASASPHVVGRRWAVESAVDPEEMLVAALSNCHMLTFLHKAREAGLVVARYHDEAEGVMETDAAGRTWLTRVNLRPVITFSGRMPTHPSPLSVWHRAAGIETSIPCMSTVVTSEALLLIVPSMRLDWPRKFATNVVRGFS